MKTKFNRGFTLIELLVVIAIIGILSSVVLASLNTARGKGADAAAKSNLNNTRAQAELFYDSNSQSYAGVCAAGANTILNGVTAGALAEGTAYVAGTNTANAGCVGLASTWVAWVKLLKGPIATQTYCVDSTGTSKVEPSDAPSPGAATPTACW